MDRAAGTPHDSQALVRTLACVLQKLVDVNRKLDTTGTQVITKFHASRPPSITVRDYLERINKYASCSTECFVLALVYIDRLIQHSNFALTSLNVHRVIITSVMLAAKFFDDQYFNNLYYAKVGGVPCKEINSLEVEFLFLINFSLHVTEEQYYRYFTELANHAMSSACPCCAGSRVPHGPSSPYKAEQSMMVITQQTPPPPPPIPAVPQHQQPQPQQIEVAAPMEVQAPPPPQHARFTYFNAIASFAEAPRIPAPPVMMARPTSSSMPVTCNSTNPSGSCNTTTTTYVAGSLPAPRVPVTHTGSSMGYSTGAVSMAEVVAADWDRAPGRHHHINDGARVKFPMDQTLLVGVGAYDYSNSYEYDYPPIMMPAHHIRGKTAAATTRVTAPPAMLYTHQPPFPVMGMQVPLMHT